MIRWVALQIYIAWISDHTELIYFKYFVAANCNRKTFNINALSNAVFRSTSVVLCHLSWFYSLLPVFRWVKDAKRHVLSDFWHFLLSFWQLNALIIFKR